MAAVAVAAEATAAVLAAAAAAAAAASAAAAAAAAHAAITWPLELVGVGGAAAGTVTHPATCHNKKRQHDHIPVLTARRTAMYRAVLTAASAAAPRLHELEQFGVDGLPGLRQNPDQVSRLPQVPRGEEGVGRPLVGAARRTSDAVDVVLGGIGIVIVDDELDVFHIFWMKSNWIHRVEERRK